jgi:hypothetical protein
MLKIPTNGAEIQEVDGVKYLVAKLDEQKNCSDFLSELRKGMPVVVPFSKRGRLTSILKKESVFTRQRTVVPGKWTTFIPCEAREFKS